MKISVWLSNHKKNVSIVWLVVFVFSLITLINFSAEDSVQNVATITKAQFESSDAFGYDVIDGGGNKGKKYIPNTSDPNVSITLSNAVSANYLVAYFKDKISANAKTQIYYTVAEIAYSEKNSALGTLLEDEKSVLFLLPEDELNSFRFDIDTEFCIDRVELQVMSDITRCVSIPATVCLCSCILFVILLAVFEKKIGYFSYNVGLLVGCVNNIKQKNQNGRYLDAVVRVMSIFSILLLGVFYVVTVGTTQFTDTSVKCLFVISIFTTIFVLCDLVINYDKSSTPKAVLLIVIITGLFMSFALPQSSVVSWDDQIHYSRTVDLKCMIFRNERTLADDIISKLLSPYNSEFYDINAQKTLLINENLKYASKRSFVNIYSNIGYLPSAFGMSVAEIFGADFLKTFFISKVAQVITYATVLYFSFKRLKGGALIFASVCLLPTAMFLASSFAYDWWVTCLVAFGYSIFISEMQQPDKKLKIKDTILMLVAMILGCGPKAIYFFLFVPLLFMAKEKFDTRRDLKRYRILVLCSAAMVLASFLLPFLINTGSQSDMRGGADVNATEQLKFIFRNPFVYAKTLVDFLLDYISFSFASDNVSFYAYLGSPRSICGTISIFAMLYCAFIDKDKADDFKNVLVLKTVSWMTVAIQLALVATALYIAFTPVGLNTVNGCSYRYIFPILLPALYSLGSVKMTGSVNKRVSFATAFSMISFNLFLSFYDVYVSKIL